jgi:hypothetical protein
MQLKDLKLGQSYIFAMADDAGLVKKGTIKGKLPVSDGWQFVRAYNVADKSAHGEGHPENCANCSKSIKYVVVLDSPETNEVHVGADCAESLVSGATKEHVEKFIKSEKNILANVREHYKNLLKTKEFYLSTSLEDLKAKAEKEPHLPTRNKLNIKIQTMENLKKLEGKTEEHIKYAIRKSMKEDKPFYDFL